MRKFYLIFFFLIAISNIHAYIDPMSGSAILYVVFGLIATLFFALKGFFYKFKNLLSGRGFVQNESLQGHDIIFYSEGKQYWRVFNTVIESLNNSGVTTAYLTSDKEDNGLNYQNDLNKSLYLGNSTASFIYLNNLNAKVVAMTTPQLDILTLKKSKHVKHYAHIVHAPTDIHTYRKFAFDYFDSIFCSGPHQKRSLRRLEEKRGIKVKELYDVGLTYYDTMLKELENIEVNPVDKKTILVAPTWQPFNIINRFGAKPLKLLLDSEYKVILRPHPQTFVSFPEVVKEIEKEIGSHPDFTIDRKPSGIESMSRSDLMISDLSGVIFDYMFLFDKPYVVLNASFNGGGMEGSELPGEFWDLDIINKVSKVIKEEEIEQLGTIVEKELNKPNSEDISAIKNDSLYNLGNSGEVAAKHLKEILDRVNSEVTSK